MPPHPGAAPLHPEGPALSGHPPPHPGSLARPECLAPYPGSLAPPEHPPPTPTTAPPRPTPRLIATTLLLALTLGAGGTWLALHLTDDTTTTTSSNKAAAPTPPGIPGPAPLPPGMATTPDPTPALPPDYTLITDPIGPTLAVPSTWIQDSARSGTTFYRGPTKAHFLQLWRISEPDFSSTDALEETAKNESNNKIGYERISLTTVPTSPHPETEELVYAFDSSETSERVRHLERVFRATDGSLYAVMVSGPDTAWPHQRTTVETALAHFTS
ncbi:hypothetical protein OG897_25020 [Streptomyces sp. NBC_00237]|uniref:hypothetical protein n=1 Tax=Streptomyces sp. NBC_00237 TaxID=2975687 RepID=UPI00224FE8B6|nr:hypothetical protein [Streptomyces sp. NBC_00237]MCX5204704.1 hypothetical protein [Streptomyces sp. NBC_00237]